MSWTLLLGIVFALGYALAVAITRRNELARMQESVQERERAIRQGADKAQLQFPVVDLTRCLGCSTCVAACPEEGVLELVHGQAMVVNGARCQGISACERECPVGAITITLGNVEERTDIPAISEELEAVGSPGLFLAGEVTAHALIKTAVDQGATVGREIARRVQARSAPSPALPARQPQALMASAAGSAVSPGSLGSDVSQASGAATPEPACDDGVLDLMIIGAGPAGLACSLEAKRHGLRYVVVDQETFVGGTVAKYPRRKLVMTQPVEMPLYGRFKRTTYTKEELVELWGKIAEEQELPIRGGETFLGLENDESGNYVVSTSSTTYVARHVLLALGRRGSPRKLGIPGEELPKVAYSLLDAHSYQGRRIVVVGGGDSAVEAAMGLAEQPGNEVTLSYRKESFFRIRSKNEKRLEACLAENKLRVVYRSNVVAIHPDSVDLTVETETGEELYRVPNDEVFVMAGGVPPFQLLQRAGVSFDPENRIQTDPITEQGTGLTRALAVGFGLALTTLLFALWHFDYYGLARVERPTSLKHDLLHPSRGIGLWLGIASVTMIVFNLLYLVRRSPRFRFTLGSLQHWMTSHIATGILALLCALLHSAMSPQDTVGGHAFWALAFLLVTGAVGRYFYAYVPRAANGRELELEEVKAQLGLMSEELDHGQRKLRERVRNEVLALIESGRWKASFAGRVAALFADQRKLRKALHRISADARTEGVDESQIREITRLAKTAHRSALVAAHYEDLRAVLNTWRYLHRWVAALMVLLVVVHVFYALTYGH